MTPQAMGTPQTEAPSEIKLHAHELRAILNDVSLEDADQLKSLRQRMESQRQQQLKKEGQIAARHRMHLTRMEQLQRDVSMRVKEVEQAARDHVRRNHGFTNIS